MWNAFKTPTDCAHLFALRPVRGCVALATVSDTYYYATHNIRDRRHRAAYYAIEGLDMERVEELYPSVEYLNRCWRLPSHQNATMSANVSPARSLGRRLADALHELGLLFSPDV